MKDEKQVLWAERTRAEFPALAEQGAVVIIPIGSTEQHGHHLPVNTDCRTAEYVSRAAALQVTDAPVLVTPTISVAISPHHMPFPGTITLRVETLLNVLNDMCESIVSHGFERILILNGHGGNRATIAAAAMELKYRLDREIRVVTWFDLANEAMDAVREGPAPGVGHSGELETSVLWAIDASVIRQDRLETVPGITDNPARASLEKGQGILDQAVAETAKLLREMAAGPGHDVTGIKTCYD